MSTRTTRASRRTSTSACSAARKGQSAGAMKTRPIRFTTATRVSERRAFWTVHPTPGIPGGKLSGRRSRPCSRMYGMMARFCQTWLPEVSTSMPASCSSSAERGSMPLPPEAFSQLATTKSMSSRAARRGRSAASALRPGRPTTSPRKRSRMRRSARDVTCPGLADHGHLDLPGIRHLLLDLAGDVTRQHGGVVVRYRPRVDDDPDLPSRLNGERLLDPLERVADPLQVLQALGVAVAVLEHAEELHQLGVDAVHTHLEHGPLARLPDGLVQLLLRLAYHLLDAPRVDAPVGEEALEREAGELATDRVVARDDHRLRRVVDDQVDPGGGLDGADVPPLAPDDPSLHVVARQRHDGDGALGDELAGQALDGDRHDLLGAPVGFLAGLGLDLPDVARGVVARLVGHLLDERALRLVARHSRRLLELLPDLVGQTFDVGLPLLHQALLRAQRVLAPRELRLALGEGLDLPIDALFLLEDSFLQGLQLVTLVARLALPVRFRLDHEVLGMELR